MRASVDASGYSSIPYWISTNSGTGAFCDPSIYSRLGQQTALVVLRYPDQTVFPNLPLREHNLVLWTPVDVYNSIIITLNNAMLAALGLRMSDFRIHEFFAQFVAPYGNRLNSSRLFASKKIFSGLEGFRKYGQLYYDAFQDLNNVVIPVFDDFPNYDDFKAKKNVSVARVNMEWEDENWVLLRRGECPPSQFDFEKVAELNPDADYTQWPCIIAEWYFDQKPKIAERSMFAEIWDNVIRSNIIPYNLTERRKKLSHAYDELKVNIKNYKETKKLIRKELKKWQAY